MYKWTGYGGEERRGPSDRLSQIERKLVRGQRRRRMYAKLKLIGEALVILALGYLLLWVLGICEPRGGGSPW